MEFEEVNDIIYRDARQAQQQTSTGSLEYDHQIIINNNPYNSLIQHHNQSGHQLISRKPTFSNFVNRLKQQSSKTRFVREYRKAANILDQQQNDYLIEDDVASLRIIDPSRDWNNRPSDDDNVDPLLIADNNKKKKKVYINESANQFQSVNDEISLNDVSIDRFVPLEKAIEYMKNDIELIQDDIEMEMKRITINQQEMIKYQQEFQWMQDELDSINKSLKNIHEDNMPDMKLHNEAAIENKQKIKENTIRKHRFERYRRTISIETRLFELEKKIKAAWRRDEIWISMRDLGFPSVVLLFLVIIFFIAWQT